MMTLIGVVQRYWRKGGRVSGSPGTSSSSSATASSSSFWAAQMQLDQIVEFFETEWEGEGGVRWLLADAEMVAQVDEVRTAYFNRVDKIRHLNARLASLVDELLELRLRRQQQQPLFHRRQQHHQLVGAGPAEGRQHEERAAAAAAAAARDVGVRIAEVKLDISELRNRRRQQTAAREELARETAGPLIARVNMSLMDVHAARAAAAATAAGGGATPGPTATASGAQAQNAALRATRAIDATAHRGGPGSSTAPGLRRRRPYTDAELATLLRGR